MSWTDHGLRPLRSTLKHNCFCTSADPHHSTDGNRSKTRGFRWFSWMLRPLRSTLKHNCFCTSADPHHSTDGNRSKSRGFRPSKKASKSPVFWSNFTNWGGPLPPMRQTPYVSLWFWRSENLEYRPFWTVKRQKTSVYGAFPILAFSWMAAPPKELKKPVTFHHFSSRVTSMIRPISKVLCTLSFLTFWRQPRVDS